VQTGQLQPITGTPTEVPVPRNRTSRLPVIDSVAEAGIMPGLPQNQC
jgi:hypothetical protein